MDKQQIAVLWEQFNAEADIERLLQSHGWTRVRERGDRVDYVRPGKSARDGISAAGEATMTRFTGSHSNKGAGE